MKLTENQKLLRQQIFKLVHSENYQPVKPRVIFKRLGLDQAVKADFKRSLKSLVKDKVLVWGGQHLVRPGEATLPDVSTYVEDDKSAQKKRSRRDVMQMVGKFRRSGSGHGSVIPTVMAESMAAATDVSVTAAPYEKIFVRAENTADAASGDLVRVSYVRKRRGAGWEFVGVVEEILKRRTNRFVGTYSEQHGAGYVTVDGGQFQNPILVGDAGAKDVQVADKVVIEMVRFPSEHDFGEGVVVEVLGKYGQPHLDTLMIMRQFDLPEEFPEPVLNEARKQAELFDETITGNRQDFTQRNIITIDPKDARDFDDAISLERIENDHWLLGVHIADVSHFVKPKSKLDEEAYRRGTSVYLPDRVIPMLPEIISNNLASLQPDRVRYAMTAMIELTSEGQLVGTEFHRTAIQSKRRFTYEEVDEYLDDREEWKSKLTPEVHQLLGDMHTLAMILRRKRLANGSLEMTLPELKLQLDRDGKVIGAREMENTESHQMIEEFMLMANVAVAQQLADQGLHVLRRIHESPNERRLNELTQFVRELGIEVQNLQNRFELKEVLDETADTQFRQAVHFGVLRSMQKAIYSPRDEGHYALNFDNYCHFTSPIRRYPDLIIHRMLGQIIDGKRPKDDFQWLTILGEHCSDREQNAEQSERELVKLKLLAYFQDRIGQEMEGVITGVEPFGVFVQGVEIPAEGLVPLQSMPDDHYYYDDRARCLMGRKSRNLYRLGDHVRVQIEKVNLEKRELDLKLLDLIGGTKTPPETLQRIQAEMDRDFAGGGRGKGRKNDKSKAAKSGKSGRKKGKSKRRR